MASGDSLRLSELRIVLLGGKHAGKSSSGNTILGREEFDLRTATQCVKRQGEVAGRQLTVVDTPGWWRNLPVEETTKLVKQEIVRSVSLCPPGPHTLLLVIDLDESFREEHRRSVEGHLQLLSERVWSHTIVLFTNGDHLGDTTIEQHIEREGKALQWLVEKCGNRYHVLNNRNRGDDTQVTELLHKMEEMVAGNRGGHYEMDREILEKIEERRRAEEERAQQRLMKVQKQRETLRSLKGDSLHLSELRIVLLGGRDAGKSSSGNTILGREDFDLRTAAQCVKRQGEVAGRQFTVVDTPGWWRNLPVESTTELVKQEIVRSVSLCPPGPHTLLLVIRLDVSFPEKHRRSVEGHLHLLSERVWRHTILLFTCGDCLGDTTIEQHIEREGKALQWLVDKCGNRYHVLNNENRSDDTQVTELLDKMEEMVARNRGDVFYQTSLLPVTRAGSYNLLPTMMSEDSRAERDDDSGRRSETGSLWSLEKNRDSRSDLLSLRSSGYGSQTSILSHLSSESNPHRSPHTRLNPEPAHSREPQGPTLTLVIPEFTSQPSETLYRLQCPHAGVFQCTLTSLVFQMEGEGEVHYRTVQWDEGQLHCRGQTPAGPLFNISCPQGSVCQLHLPHCEIPSGEGVDSLSVAHVSGDDVELLPPLRVTDTHVVVNITDLSLWGLVRQCIPFLTTRGQVLPFHQPLGPLHSVLNLIVLPHNVPLQEVERMQRNSSYIAVCSDCTLSRGEVYNLCCDVERYKIQPKRVAVHWNYGPNYHPTFQVFLSTDTKEVELRLLEGGGEGEEVWAASVPLTGSSSGRQTEHARKGSAEEQLRSTRLEFVERVSMPVLDNLLYGLLQEKVINGDEREAVKVKVMSKDRAWATIDMVLKKGPHSCFVMKTMLSKYDPALYTTLGFH